MLPMDLRTGTSTFLVKREKIVSSNDVDGDAGNTKSIGAITGSRHNSTVSSKGSHGQLQGFMTNRPGCIHKKTDATPGKYAKIP